MGSQHPFRIRARFLVLAVAPVALLVAGQARAQVPSAERRCIEEINNSTRKVLLAEERAIQGCTRSFVKGTLATPTVEACAAPAASTPVSKAMAKALAGATKRCPSGPPSFGPPALNAHPGLAVQAGASTLDDLFGSNVESALLTDKLGSRCQAAVLKAVHRCDDTRQKEFLACKKRGLKSGLIHDEASLQEQCLGTGAEQPDPKNRITGTCQAKLEAQINALCLAPGILLSQAFPGCSDTTSAGLVGCLNERSRCRVCSLLNDVDGLARDCDAFDDGDDDNSSCVEPTTCGDLIVDGQEECEDGDATGGDGCSASCRVELGWSCSGHPSVCTEICGDGVRVGAEACDDGGTTSGDGCSSTCQVESGYSCSGTPSSCSEVCGDGQIVGGEECDDDDTDSGDGCNVACTIEPGWACQGEPSSCTRFDVTITSPAHGIFTTASSTTVTGVVTALPPALAHLTINGTTVPVQPNGSFSANVALSSAAIFNPIRAIVSDTVHGGSASDRIVVVSGSSVIDGNLSPQSVGLRLNDSGLDKVEPVIAEFAGDGLDLGALLPVGTVVVANECFIDSFLGCLGRGTVRVASPAPSVSGFEIEANSRTNFVEGDITVHDIDVNLFLDGTSGLVPDCGIFLNANQAFFMGDYTLSPDSVEPSNIDVSQIGNLGVSFAGFQHSFDGICDSFLIGDLIQLFLPDIEALTIDALEDFLKDPDGAGPADGPIAGAIEDALAGISIAGPIGASLGVILETPLFAVNEDEAGITLGSNSRVILGSGPGMCVPPPGAPSLTRSLAHSETFPTYGVNSPVLNQPYDVAISISSEGFNQLLRAQTECGLLVTSISELDLGFGPLPITTGLLSLLIPEFAVYPPTTPVRIDVRPTLAPVVTGLAGSGGELTELRIAQVLAQLVVDDGSDEVLLSAAFDANVGMNLVFQPGELAVSLSEVDPSDVQIAIIDNPLNVDAVALEETVLPSLVGELLPDLSSSLSSFPLPEFFDLQLSGVEISRANFFMSLYARLQAAP